METFIPKGKRTPDNVKDLGLEHIRELHISAFRDSRAIYNEFSRKYGQKKSHEIVDSLYAAADESQEELYKKKNKDYDIAMIFSGGYDADIVRKSCNWISEHKEAFGKEILEIGCDCGFITTFLGSFFPDKHITAIERCPEGIEIAKKNVEKFSLNNIDFICDDVTNLSGKKYDTVFSMRTMHENGALDNEDYSNEFVPQAEIFSELIRPYSTTVTSLVKDNGTLISIERVGFNSLLFAWIKELYNSGCKLESHVQLNCKEVGDDKVFQAMVFRKSNDKESDSYVDFMNCFMEYVDPNLPEYFGWEAKIMYDFSSGKLIKGYEVVDKRNKLKSKVIVRQHKTDDSCILLHNNNNGDVHLTFHDISEKEDGIGVIEKAVDEVRNLSYMKITEIVE